MVVDWDPGRYRDTYRDELLAAIREKADSGAIEPRNVPEEGAEAPVDLVSLLQKSVAGAKRRKNGKRAA
jgi:non-homologous end joining protein Ku